MTTPPVAARVAAFDDAMAEARRLLHAGDPGAALQALRDAHVLGQQDFTRHLRAHWQMLRVALALRDAREVSGQVARLLLVPLGHLSGRLPIGNPGTADVGAFTPRPIPSRLQRLIDGP